MPRIRINNRISPHRYPLYPGPRPPLLLLKKSSARPVTIVPRPLNSSPSNAVTFSTSSARLTRVALGSRPTTQCRVHAGLSQSPCLNPLTKELHRESFITFPPFANFYTRE